MIFIRAPELKKEFDVFGHFYSLETGTNTYPCRSSLEIIKKGINIDAPKIAEADAIFVLMNPGSSKPLKNSEELVVKESSISKLNIELVTAQPDPTQYQLMRVMLHKKWNHARVINLSDLCDSNSGSFIELLNEYFGSHSIFSDSRSNELAQKLARKDTAPIVLAWGTNDKLGALIQQAYAKLKDYQLQGCKREGTVDKYYHPLPLLQKDKEKWVEDIIQRLGVSAQ